MEILKPAEGLAGPDGKVLEKQSPEARRMPSRQEKFNMIYMMVTLMTREERQMLKKSLRPLIRELDLKYPNGMTEGDMKNDLEKAANEVLSDVEGHAEPPSAESAAPLDVPVQREGDESVAESTPGGEGK